MKAIIGRAWRNSRGPMGLKKLYNETAKQGALINTIKMSESFIYKDYVLAGIGFEPMTLRL